MPPFSTDDYHKLLQKIAVMETKIRQLELNAEVNGHYMDETTLPISQNTDREQANGLLTSTTRMQPALREKGNISTSPPWNSLGAKPKHYKSPPPVMGRRLSGRSRHQETHDNEWPALPSHTAVSSTPAPERKKQPWTKATTKTRSSMPRNTGIPLKNRFSPLSQSPNSSKESPSSTRERYVAESDPRSPQRVLTTGPQTLIVGDGVVNDIKRFCSKNTKVLCFANDMVSDVSERILNIAAEYPTAKSLIIHMGALDVMKQQSEVLKQDFLELVNKARCLHIEVFFSGPIPSVRGGDERFSRLLMLNRWLKNTCATHSINFIDNFNIFWGRRHLFKADGFHLNRSGGQLLSTNIFYLLRHKLAAPVKDKTGQDVPKQQIRECSGESAEEGPATSSSSCQREESSPATTGDTQPPAPAPPHIAPNSLLMPRSPQLAPLRLDYTSCPLPGAAVSEDSSDSLDIQSPSSPMLEFTDHMNRLVTAGIKLTPRPSESHPKPKPRQHPNTSSTLLATSV